MASVAKHPKSKFWYACYTDRDGKQRKISSRTTDKRKAIRFALEIEAEEQKSREIPQTNTQLQKALADLSQRINGDSVDVPEIEDYFNDWLEQTERRVKPDTYKRYEKSIREFVKSLGKASKNKLTEITPKHLSEFVRFRQRKNLAPATIILDCKVVGTALRRAEKFGTITKNPVPASSADFPLKDSSEKDIFTPDEVQDLLNAAPHVEWQTVILLSYLTGARLSDCTHMAWDSIKPDEGLVIYHPRKTRKKVVVPMHRELIKHLLHIAQFRKNEYLAPTLVHKNTGGNGGLSAQFKRIMKKAEVDPRERKGKGTRKFSGRSFHSLRHTFNSALANAGVSEEIRMKLTGHTTRAVHAGYTHFEVSPLKAAIDSAPLINTSSG